jgi:hypothetical protein
VFCDAFQIRVVFLRQIMPTFSRAQTAIPRAHFRR